MMFHPQQNQQNPASQQPFANAPSNNGGHQSPYGTAAGAMGGGPGNNAGAVGMMPQSNGLAQMPAGHGSQYQTPYNNSPYGSGMPTVPNPSMQQNFLPQTSNPPNFAMNAPTMTPQHQMQNQRMQPPGSNVTPSAQRTSPYGGISQQGTPPNAAMQQSQFSTPQNPAQNMGAMQNANQPGQGGGTVVTPQTPTFPQGQGSSATAGPTPTTPLSPGSEAREKERVTLLLEINRELLLESMQLQALIAEGKKEAAAASAESQPEKDKTEKDKAQAAIGKEYLECMRRLQSNLAYLASIADRSHKPSNQIPPHPAIMSAPNLSQKPAKAPKATDSATATPTKDESGEEKKFVIPNEDRDKILKEQYKRLQALFPGVDPTKEPPLQPANAAARAAQMQAQQQAKQQQQQQQSVGGGAGPTGDAAQLQQQQKLQQHNQEMLRQRMLLEQAAKQQQIGLSGPMGPPSQPQPQNQQPR